MNPQTSINATRGIFALFIPVFLSAAAGYALFGNAVGDQILLVTMGIAAVVWGAMLNTGRFDDDKNGAH